MRIPGKILNWWLAGLAGLVWMAIPLNGNCQQDPVYTQYLNNMLTVQPAYAGVQAV